MTAPRQRVEGHRRRVGQLHEEDLPAGDIPDRRRIITQREEVEAVKADAEGRVVRGGHQPPGVPVVPDEPAPRQSLVSHGDAVRAGQLREPVQLAGGALVVVDGGRRDGRADQHGVRAQVAHQHERPLGPAEVVLSTSSGTASKSRNG